jgi:translation initiation factor 1
MRLFAGTEFDRPPRCERCGELEEDCACPPPPPQRLPPEDQTAKVSLQKRKRGKSVTVVSGLAQSASDLPELLTRLKQVCGAGGTLKAGVMEIQGDQVSRVVEELRGIGYRVNK